MTTHVYESALIPHSFSKTWELLKTFDFSFLSNLKSSTQEGSTEQKLPTVGSIRSLEYFDKTIQTIKILEISEHHHRLQYQLISSEPSIEVLSVINSIRLHRVSWNPNTEEKVDFGFLELGTDFSSDVQSRTLEDSKWKKFDFFIDLISFLEGKQKKVVKETKKKEEHQHDEHCTHEKEKKEKKETKEKPNFTGVWVCERSEGLKEFLASQGFPDKVYEVLEKKKMIQVIKHTEKLFAVSSDGHITTYVVGGPAEAEARGVEALLLSNMVWDGETLVSVAVDGPSSHPESSTLQGGGGLISRRLMVGKQLCLVMQNKSVTCKRYFNLVPQSEQTPQMQELAKQVFLTSDSPY